MPPVSDHSFKLRISLGLVVLSSAAGLAFFGKKDITAFASPLSASTTSLIPASTHVPKAGEGGTANFQTPPDPAPESPRGLILRVRAAKKLIADGNHAAAETEHRAVLAVRERILGPNHPDTLLSRKFLAAALFQQGKYGEARKEYEAVLSVLWPDRETVETGWLATWRQILPVWFPKGLEAESHEAYLAALDSMSQVFFVENPEPAPGLPFRAVMLDHLGRYQEAEEILRDDKYKSMEKFHGTEGPEFLRSRHYLDSPLRGQERFSEVEANERDILSIQERVLGAGHEDVYATRLFLAISLMDQDKFGEAKIEATKAYNGFLKTFGSDSYATISAANLLREISELR